MGIRPVAIRTLDGRHLTAKSALTSARFCRRLVGWHAQIRQQDLSVDSHDIDGGNGVQFPSEPTKGERDRSAFGGGADAASDGKRLVAGEKSTHPLIVLNDVDADYTIHRRAMDEGIAAWNSDADGIPKIYSRAGTTMFVDPSGAASEMSDFHMRDALAEACIWKRVVKDGWKGAIPPLEYCKAQVVVGHERLPALDSISPHPILVKDGGAYALRMERGYSGGRLITDGLELAELMHVSDAVALLKDLFHDIPFASGIDGGDFASLLAFALSPVVKPAVNTTPVAVFVKPQKGTGGTLAMETACAIALGAPVDLIAPPTGKYEEENKQVFAELIKGKPFMPYDNVVASFGGAMLAAAITASSQTITQRVLGKSEMRTVKIASVVGVSSNGVRLTPDMLRRSYPISLTRAVSRPDTWRPERGWRHPNLKRKAVEPQYRAALISLVHHWIECGAVLGETEPIGGFEDWAGVVSGILAHAGIGGFLAGRSDWIGKHDVEQVGWGGVVSLWVKMDGGAPRERTAAELETMLTQDDAPDLPFALRDGDANKGSRTRAIGGHISKAENSVVAIDDGTSWRIGKRIGGGNKAYYSLVNFDAGMWTDAGAPAPQQAAFSPDDEARCEKHNRIYLVKNGCYACGMEREG